MSTLTHDDLEKALQTEDTLNVIAVHLAKDIGNEVFDISAFVERIGFALTSPTIGLRVNGTKLLSLVLSNLPKDFLNVLQIEFLTTFYIDRLKDHHNVMPAVIEGVEALIAMKHLPNASITNLLKNFFAHTSCQSQVRNDRARLFSIFKYLYEQYPEELKSMSADFIYGLINSIDGERDPRNLDFIFTFMPNFISTMPLYHLSEEMFEIFACYFPIDFNPSKNDPDTITRDNLSEKLINCLVASPDFIEWTVSLALEKLESDLIVAKLDALELLYQAALKFEPQAMAAHFQEIWTALKKEIFPGTDNADIVAAGLKTLRGILEQAGSKSPDASHEFQTIVLGNILPHLSDVNQRLFNPSTAIGLVCISGDASFAGEKILNTFLLKLNTSEPAICNEHRIKIYTIIAQIFKIISLRNALEQIKGDFCMQLHTDLINSMRLNNELITEETLDLKRASLSALKEGTLIINEVNRALIYRELVHFITHETVDFEFTHFLEQLGALHPIELQSHLIDVCIRKFSDSSSFVQEKIYKNLLPLVKQIAFTERIMDLLLSHIFDAHISSEVRLLALKSLNTLLTNEDKRFITHLQHDNCLIDKLITLALNGCDGQLNSDILQQISIALSLLIQQLDITEQYIIASEYLSKLNVESVSNLFVTKGILSYLHKDISLDDQFEGLLNNLIKLSLENNDDLQRQVAHHLLCSLVNKIEANNHNMEIIEKTIAKTKAQISQQNSKAVEVLSWVAKGLVVRGVENFGEIIKTLAELLDDPTLSSSALQAFEVLSGEYPQLHLPTKKYLYKQKLFHIIMHTLGKGLDDFSETHLNAFIYTLKATPNTVLKFNIEKIGPILFKSLESKQVQILCISLEICEHFIKQQDEYFRSHLQHLIPSCLRLSTFRESMKVRITALNLLYDMTKYPVFVLLPHKMDVVLELANALDDSKRLVRNAAVRASNSWYLVGAPNAVL